MHELVYIMQQAVNQTFLASRKENQRSWFCMRIGFSDGGGFDYISGFGYFRSCLVVAVFCLAMFHVSVVRGRRLKHGLAAVTTLNRFTNTVDGAQMELEEILSSHRFGAELAGELQQ